MDQEIRNKLRGVVTQCRRLLEDDVRQVLEGKYAIFARKETIRSGSSGNGSKDAVTADPNAPVTHLSEEERDARKDILDHYAHIQARGFKPKEALDQLVREIAFTHLNRLCAYKMMEAREVYVGGQKFREAVSRGVNSNGVKFYLAEHPDDERLYSTGQQEVAYRHFLDWLGGLLSDEIGVLFNPNDPANRLYPRQKTLDDVLDLLNGGGIKAEETELREQWPQIWSQDETIGWVYQYFTPKELRDQARKESQAPRNSYELAFRNQFFTPRYVVEFLTDNTLGRIWYEMRKGDTKLAKEGDPAQCRYMVRRPTEIFLNEGEQPPKDAATDQDERSKDDLSQEELLKLPVYIPHRPKKDPRELKILDPACGSGHFLLYCFDLLLTIYEEAYTDEDLGEALRADYPTLDELRRDVPRLILAHNLHGIDIDLRASQIAALALWLRCQRAWQDLGLKKDRPQISRSNFVCAEPMPGEEQMLKEFVAQLEPKVLGQVVEVVFDKMKLAGEAGSLLKIEEELRDAVAEAKRQFLAGPVTIQRSLFDDPQPVARQQRFDFSGLTDEQFFEQAEAKAIEALRSYAENAQNGQRLQRRLFTEDAVRGFALVDFCQKRYDAVLMNPPFGKVSSSFKSAFEASYTKTKNDIYAAFVERGLGLLLDGGMLGAITSRTGFFLTSFRQWREDILLQRGASTILADLGYGVLDAAMVETAAYCLKAKRPSEATIFIRLLQDESKQAGLSQAIDQVTAGTQAPNCFVLNPLLFSHIPLSPFAYWVNTRVRKLFTQLPSLAAAGLDAQSGASTMDDFRFLRCWWETKPELAARSREDTLNGLRWVPFAKGGAYSPYYANTELSIDWQNDGEVLKETISRYRGSRGWGYQWTAALNGYKKYFRAGLTWPRRSTSGFSPRILAAGMIFGDKGPACFVPPGLEYAALGILFSQTYQRLIEISLAAGEETQSGTASRSYEVGLVEKLPWPNTLRSQEDELSALTRTLVTGVQSFHVTDELSHFFVSPFCCRGPSIRQSTVDWERYLEKTCVELLSVAAHVENLVTRILFGDLKDPLELTSGDARSMLTHDCTQPSDNFDELYSQSIHDTINEWIEEEGGNRQVAVKSYYVSRHLEVLSQTAAVHPAKIAEIAASRNLLPKGALRAAASMALSYAVGCCLGRWDIRLARNPTTVELPDPFLPLPIYPLGAIKRSDDIPFCQVSPYPLRIEHDGILADDPDHFDDIVRRVREVLELIWKDRAEAIEKEACEILGVKELRDYFRKPGKGGFWDDHISRYSKSRRKAPIYWLLQSSKRNYALWLYYHRLDKDLLFKALVNYVEPKLRLETSRLETLRSQQAAAGASGKEAKRLAKEVERQEDFISELQDFEDKLRRAANLHLEPDLNDGVVLNIAPLWELVPWKEAKKYWDELMAGKYEWSTIGKQLREKGLVR